MAVQQIVLDTSALLAVLVSEPERPALLRVTEGATLVAPASLHWELGNALSAMLRRHRIDGPQAASAIASYGRVPLRLVDVDLPTAVELAEQLGLYAYDAYFLVCALVHRAPLLTLDGALGRAARKAGIRLVEVR